MYQHWVNVSCLLLVGKAQSCCIVCIGLLTKHADWPIRSTARELTAELTARELKICLNSTSMYNTRCLFATLIAKKKHRIIHGDIRYNLIISVTIIFL